MSSSPVVDALSPLPIVGPWASRAGRVQDILATPCQSSPEAWVKAAVVSSPRLLYLFAKPFLIADQWHARTGRGHRRAKGIIRLIQEGTKKAGITDTKFFIPFKITGDFILKAEWYLMIADRTTEFAVNWTSMAYLYSGCNTPASRWIQVSRTGGTLYLTSTPVLVGPMFGTEWPGIPVVTGLVGIPAKYVGTVSYDFSGKPHPIEGFPTVKNWHVELRNVIVDAESNGMDFTSHNNDVQGGADISFHQGLNTNTELYGIFISGDEGFLDIESCSLGAYAYKAGEKGLTFDP